MIFSGALVVGQRAFATVVRHVEVAFSLGHPSSVEIRLFDPTGGERGKLCLSPQTWRPLLAAIRDHRRGDRGEIVSVTISARLEVALVSIDSRELTLALRTINDRAACGKPHRFVGDEIDRLEEAFVLAIGARS